MNSKISKFIIFILFVFLSSCGGGTGSSEGLGNPATPPLPVFGDFVLRVAVSQTSSSNNLSRGLNSNTLNSVNAAGNQILINETRQLNRDIIVWKQKYYEMFGKELGQSEEDIIIHFFDDIDIVFGRYIVDDATK